LLLLYKQFSSAHTDHQPWIEETVDRLTFIIHYMSRLFVVERVDDLVESIIFIPICILRLSPVSRTTISPAPTVSRITVHSLMEEEGIIWFSALHQPMHRLDHVRPGRDLTGIPSIVTEHHNVFRSVVVSVFCQLVPVYTTSATHRSGTFEHCERR